MKINSIIIDDEPLARKGLKEYIADVDFLNFCGEFDNPLKASGFISKEQPDLIFLDIQMPKMSGIDFLKTLSHPPKIIFTTAYPQYAVDSYELDVLDYLVKPISFDRFFKAVMKAKERMGSDMNQKELQQVANDHVFIKTDGKFVKIFFKDILFIEALQNYVCIHTTEKKHIAYLTFKNIEERLPSDLFIKVHKSYMVSINKITSIEGNEIIAGAHRIPVSRNLKEDVVEKLLKGKIINR
ncbi:MAG: response regulator transcription factor [Chitinophagaceae bacterium]|nr:response regulator transcription factor [Chitinophagaceae bacterium]